MSILYVRRLLCVSMGCLMLAPLSVSAQCQSAETSTAAGQTPTAQSGVFSQLGALQNLMAMQQNLQLRQQQPIQITPQQRLMQQQMLMSQIRRQQETANSRFSASIADDNEPVDREESELSGETAVDLSQMSRLERKKFAIRERRRLNELARTERSKR